MDIKAGWAKAKDTGVAQPFLPGAGGTPKGNWSGTSIDAVPEENKDRKASDTVYDNAVNLHANYKTSDAWYEEWQKMKDDVKANYLKLFVDLPGVGRLLSQYMMSQPPTDQGLGALKNYWGSS